jgi:hypothetical protein
MQLNPSDDMLLTPTATAAPLSNAPSTTRSGTNALGWLSLALGATALCAPASTARLLGAPLSPRSARTLRAVGLREIAVGVGLLKSKRPTAWTWMRVAGDVMDMTLLLSALGARRSRPQRLAGSVAVIGAVLAVDVIASMRRSSNAAA